MKNFMILLAFIIILAFGAVAYAHSDAGFLEGAGSGFWYCKHSDGSFWAWVTDPNQDEFGYPEAVQWCEGHGYRW